MFTATRIIPNICNIQIVMINKLPYTYSLLLYFIHEILWKTVVLSCATVPSVPSKTRKVCRPTLYAITREVSYFTFTCILSFSSTALHYCNTLSPSTDTQAIYFEVLHNT